MQGQELATYPQMNEEAVADLYDRLRITIDRAERGRVQIADEIEYVLTEGYAYALNLELRPQRIEKRIVELVTSGNLEDEELRKLARQKLNVDRELGTLRETLAQLQEHCDRLKAEGRVAMRQAQLARPAEPPDST
jgi:hypothetical protein